MIRSRFSRSIKATLLVMASVFVTEIVIQYCLRNFLTDFFSKHILLLLLVGPIIHWIIYNPNRARKFDNEKFKKTFPVCTCCHAVFDKEKEIWLKPLDFIDQSTIHDSTRGICDVCYELFHAKKPD